jgi:hypothetical protein
LAITTIRVVHRADTFLAKGMMLKSVSMSKVRVRHKLKLSVIAIGTVGAKLSEVVRGIGRRM